MLCKQCNPVPNVTLKHYESKEKISSKHANTTIAISVTDLKKSIRLLKSFEIDEITDDLSSLSKNLCCGMGCLKLGTEYELEREGQLFQGASWEASGAASC